MPSAPSSIQGRPCGFPSCAASAPSRSSASTRPSRRRRSLPPARLARRSSTRWTSCCRSSRRKGSFAWCSIHHPPLPGQAPPRRALRDAGALASILAARGAELVLHGHNHRDMHTDFARIAETGGGSIPVIGVASGSIGRVHKGEPLGRYNLLRIARVDGRAHIECVTRGLDCERQQCCADRAQASSRRRGRQFDSRKLAVARLTQSPRSVVARAAAADGASAAIFARALLNACARLRAPPDALHKSMARAPRLHGDQHAACFSPSDRSS